MFSFNHLSMVAAFTAIACGAAVRPAAAAYTYTTVGNPAVVGGYAYALNNSGQVATTSLVTSHFFADSTTYASPVEITIPGITTATSTPGVVAQGMNDAGEVVGRYRVAELITFVPDPPIIIPEELEELFAFTGAQAGDPLWNIPFSQEQDKPWTGLSTESVSSADFSNIRYQLTAFSGPGQMSLLQWGVFGNPLLEMQTSDGLSGDDVIDLPARTHSHYEWIFTAPGVYTFELTAFGTLTPAAGGGTVSAAETFKFHVAVPEPGAIALLALGAPVGAVFRRSHRSRYAAIGT